MKLAIFVHPKHLWSAGAISKEERWIIVPMLDYWVLNKVTVKNKYSAPLIANLFDRLRQAKYFTKMDL